MTSRARATNNSVSTLEEQSVLLSSVFKDVSKEKAKDTSKISKNRKQRKIRKVKPAESLSRPPSDESDMADMFVNNEEDDSSTELTWEQAKAIQDHQMAIPNQFPQQMVEDDEVSLRSNDFDQNGGHDHSISDDDAVSDTVSQQDLTVKPVELSAEKSAIPEIKSKGVGADLLKEQLAQVKEADKVSLKVSQPVAVGIDKYLKEPWYATEMDKLAKQYPRVENINHLKVPKLDTEVYQLVEQHVRNLDQSFQSVQKALISGLSALAPVLDLAIQRGDTDVELDPLTKNLMNGMQLVSFAVNGISTRRKELLKPCLAPAYARVLTKGHDTTPEWLFGGDLLTTTKKCEAAKRIGEKVLRSKNPQQKGNVNNNNNNNNNNNKRFKPNFQQSSQGMLRANQFPQQSNRFQVPQQQGYQYQVPQFPTPQQFFQPQGFQKQQRFPRNQQPNQQGFKKNNSFPK